MKRSMRLAAAFACLVIPICSCASDLNRVVRTLEADLGVRHTRIPMLGMAMFVGKVATGFQMPGVKLAVFDDSRLSEHSPQELEAALVKALGPAWSPIVKSISRHGDEQNWIYMRENGKKWQMFIATVEKNELSLVEVKIGEGEMRRWINDTDEMARGH